MRTTHYSLPRVSRRWFPVWRRNFLVWRKLFGPSMLGNFGEPLLYLLALGYGLGHFVGDIGQTRYIDYLAAGIVCSTTMMTASFEGLYSAYTRMAVQKTWDSILSTPVGLDDILFGEMIWAGSKSVLSATPIILVAALLGAVHDAWAILAIFMVMLAGAVFGALALVMTAVARGYDFFIYYFTLVITPMFLFSGVFFPLDGMPVFIRVVAACLPLNHVVEVVRPLMVGGEVTNVFLHVGVLLAYGIAGFTIASVLFRRRLLS